MLITKHVRFLSLFECVCVRVIRLEIATTGDRHVSSSLIGYCCRQRMRRGTAGCSSCSCLRRAPRELALVPDALAHFGELQR